MRNKTILFWSGNQFVPRKRALSFLSFSLSLSLVRLRSLSQILSIVIQVDNGECHGVVVWMALRKDESDENEPVHNSKHTLQITT